MKYFDTKRLTALALTAFFLMPECLLFQKCHLAKSARFFYQKQSSSQMVENPSFSVRLQPVKPLQKNRQSLLLRRCFVK